MPALLIVLALALLPGCYEQSHLSGDASGDDASPVDTHLETQDIPADEVLADIVEADEPVEPDVPFDGCPTSYYWELEPRQIVSVSQMLGGPNRVGVTERLWVDVQLTSSCDFLGDVAVRLSPGDATDFVGLAASAWAPRGLDCLPSAPIVTWIVEVPGRGQDNMRVVVTDENFPGGGLRLEYEREPCPDPSICLCQADSPPGPGGEWSDCLTDCSCAAGLACISYYGVAGPLWNCVRPCNDFLDCENRVEQCFPPVPDGAPNVCTSGNECTSEDPCPPGFTCDIVEPVGTDCLDQRAFPDSRPCACDEACPAGHRCVLSYRGEPTCEVPCLRDADCPNPPDSDVYVCGTPKVCVVLD
jgi:hypothetical protein